MIVFGFNFVRIFNADCRGGFPDNFGTGLFFPLLEEYFVSKWMFSDELICVNAYESEYVETFMNPEESFLVRTFVA